MNPIAGMVADVNGDDEIDVLAVNASSNDISIFLGRGDGSFQSRVDVAAGLVPADVAMGDFNGDGKPDLAVATANGVQVLLNTSL